MSDPVSQVIPVKTIMSREGAEKYLPGIIEGTRVWYWEQTFKWETKAKRLTYWSLGLSSIVTVVAAMPVGQDQYYRDLLKWTVVIISTASTFASALLTKSGIERRAQLREQGRNAMEVIKSKAINRLSGIPMTDEERAQYMESLIIEVGSVEEKYGFWKDKAQ